MATKLVGGTDGMHRKPDSAAGKKMGGGWKNHSGGGKATSQATHKNPGGSVKPGHTATSFKGR